MGFLMHWARIAPTKSLSEALRKDEIVWLLLRERLPEAFVLSLHKAVLVAELKESVRTLMVARRSGLRAFLHIPCAYSY
jgi:hypothetical protein